MRASVGGEVRAMRKTTAHTWELSTRPGERVELNYRCNASELSAGNTYLDHAFLLINPVNCLVYPLGMELESSRIELELPQGWNAATSFVEDSTVPEQIGNRMVFHAKDIQELLDTPILASGQLHSLIYSVDGIDFHVHIHGERAFDEDRLINDFRAFTQVQVDAFGSFPVETYHFLIIFTPFRAYHGVEHEKSTVIIIGPSAELADWKLYRELLGVASHELYHTWNVKYLRPKSWAPYDFTGPAHERLGYIAEGVTTYMGDWMLWQAGVFDDGQYFEELAAQVKKHWDNDGRRHLSLGDAAIDTWTDGYGRGAPRRRVSIYTEGALLAFVTDVWLLKESGGKRGLADFMKGFCSTYGGDGGYTEEQWWEGLQEGSALDWGRLKDDLVDGRNKFQDYVNNALEYLGLCVHASDSEKLWERDWGVSIEGIGGQWVVLNMALEGPAEHCGLWFGDEVLEVNGQGAEAFFTQDSAGFPTEASLKVRFGGAERVVYVSGDGASYFQRIALVQQTANEATLPFNSWKHLLSKRLEKNMN